MRRKLALLYSVVFLGALVLYVISCAPGVLWQDSGMFQLRIWANDIEGDLGLALAHPLYILIGMAVKQIPFGEFAYKINLISAACGAFAVANLFLAIRLWLGKNLSAFIGALTFAFSWTIWQHSSMAEVYTLHLALFGGELIMLIQFCKTKRPGWLYALALFNSLGVANHMFASISFACYFVFIIYLLTKKTLRPKHLALMAVIWIIGAAAYEYLIIKNIIERGEIGTVLMSAAFGKNWAGDVLSTSMSIQIIKQNLMFILYSFPTPNFVLFFAGIFCIYKLSSVRSFVNILLAMLILFFVFAFRYTVPDRYVFFMPFYMLLCVFIAAGADILVQKFQHKAIAALIVLFTLLPIAVYAFVPTFAENRGISMPTRRTIPYRNDYKWFLQPWRTGYNGPRQFATEVFDMLKTGDFIYADTTAVRPLLYGQLVENRGKHITVTANQNVLRETLAAGNGDVYIVSREKGYCPAFVIENYDLAKAGSIWRIVEKTNVSD